MKKCLHQVFRSKKISNRQPGVGVCIECEYDPEENKKCKRYTPVNFMVIDIEEKEDIKSK
jgi:hypothetical protein